MNARSRVVSKSPRLEKKKPKMKLRNILVAKDTVNDTMTAWLNATRMINKDEFVYDISSSQKGYVILLDTEK
jgi:hypothetical protein